MTFSWCARGVGHRRSRRDPRVLERGVQGGPGEVEARAGHLRLKAGEQAQGLGVALEAAAGQRAAGVRERGQGRLAVVAERRVAEVVRQAGGVDQVGVAAERRAELAADLRALERVGQPGAREVAGPGPAPPASSRRACAARSCAGPARGPAGTACARRAWAAPPPSARCRPDVRHVQCDPLDRHSRPDYLHFAVRDGGRARRWARPGLGPGWPLTRAGQPGVLSGCRCRRWRRAARPASRRAIGTRNGEQDT